MPIVILFLTRILLVVTPVRTRTCHLRPDAQRKVRSFSTRATTDPIRVEKWLSFHVAHHGQIKPSGTQPSLSLVWVQSFLLLDELLDDLPEPVIPQVTRSLKRTWPAVGKTLYSYRPPGGLPMGTAPDSPPEELLTYAGALSLI